MERDKFDEILNNILLPYLDYTEKEMKIYVKLSQEFKDKVYEKYEAMRMEVKNNFMKKKDNRINRHKIASLFYIAFVDVAKDVGFIDFRNGNDILEEDTLYLFVHNVAFNVAIGIIENFIYAAANEKEYAPGYYLYVKERGIIAQIENYSDYAIKEIISVHKTDSLSPFLLANIFYFIEHNSEEKFKTLSEDKRRKYIL
jgi:hypothetical protein